MKNLKKSKVGKSNNGKELEVLVAKIEKTLAPYAHLLVEHNTKIKDKSGTDRQFDAVIWDKSDERQIFVSLVECRDYNKKLGVEYIDAFVGKTNDIANVKHRIIVSANGFTKDCISKAKQHGIKIYTLNNVSEGEIQDLAEDGNRMIQFGFNIEGIEFAFNVSELINGYKEVDKGLQIPDENGNMNSIERCIAPAIQNKMTYFVERFINQNRDNVGISNLVDNCKGYVSFKFQFAQAIEDFLTYNIMYKPFEGSDYIRVEGLKVSLDVAIEFTKFNSAKQLKYSDGNVSHADVKVFAYHINGKDINLEIVKSNINGRAKEAFLNGAGENMTPLTSPIDLKMKDNKDSNPWKTIVF